MAVSVAHVLCVVRVQESVLPLAGDGPRVLPPVPPVASFISLEGLRECAHRASLCILAPIRRCSLIVSLLVCSLSSCLRRAVRAPYSLSAWSTLVLGLTSPLSLWLSRSLDVDRVISSRNALGQTLIFYCAFIVCSFSPPSWNVCAVRCVPCCSRIDCARRPSAPSFVVRCKKLVATRIPAVALSLV